MYDEAHKESVDIANNVRNGRSRILLFTFILAIFTVVVAILAVKTNTAPSVTSGEVVEVWEIISVERNTFNGEEYYLLSGIVDGKIMERNEPKENISLELIDNSELPSMDVLSDKKGTRYLLRVPRVWAENL